MRYIGIIILLVLCLTLLLLTGCMINPVTPEIASGNLENQEDIYQSSNNSQSSSTGLIYEPGTEEPAEDPGTVYPQKWATGDGTAENPWANSCIESAYAACPAGGTIFLRAGYYQLADYLVISKAIDIIGEGRNNTIIKTANDDGFFVRHDNCTLKGFTVDGDAQEDAVLWRSIIDISNCDYALLEDIEAKNGGYYGMNIYQVNHSLFQNIYAHDNYKVGLHPGSATTGRNKWNTYQDIYAWNNGHDGFMDRGNSNDQNEQCYNTWDNLNCWDNGLDGIMIGGQTGGVLSNSSASGNGRYGIRLWEAEDSNIHDCFTTLNKEEGIWVQLSDNINFTNVMVKNNNALDTDDIGGILIEGSSGIKFTSCQSYDDRDTPLQRYGLQLTGTSTDISLSNCTLTPNSLGEIYNPAGAVVTIITEKREFLPLSLLGSETTEETSVYNL